MLTVYDVHGYMIAHPKGTEPRGHYQIIDVYNDHFTLQDAEYGSRGKTIIMTFSGLKSITIFGQG
jgi:hypothetical protein